LSAASAAAQDDARSLRVLLVSTFAFMVCFAIWMMFGVTVNRSGRNWG
jgi:nitrate/nitrite transporter NarK